MMHSVRTVTVDDAAEIIKVLNPIIQAGGYTIMNELQSVADQLSFIRSLPEPGIYNIAVDDASGRALGVQDVLPLSSTTADSYGEVSTFVSLDARRTGIGRSLCQMTFAQAKSRGFRKLQALIRSDNPGALAFYRSQGFEISGTSRIRARIRGRYIDQVVTEMFLG